MGSNRLWMAVVLAGAVGACGDNASPGDGNPPANSDKPLLPWATGYSWTYQVTDEGETTTKETTVGAQEPVGGDGPNKDVMAYKVVTRKGAMSMDMTVSWQAPKGDLIVRYREQSFSASRGDLELEEHWAPYKIHVDGSAAHRVEKATWLEQYDETARDIGKGTTKTETKADRWSVESADQEITVPAGTFRAVVFRKVGPTTAKTYWYVPGIGKVRETGGQTEELIDYEVGQ